MYVPPKYSRQDVQSLVECSKEHSFALVLTGANHATWVPMVAIPSKDYKSVRFEFHMARANPHAQLLAEQKTTTEDTTIVFLGPHGYISPRWYTDRVNNVPTWNFIAYHVKGRPRLVSEQDELYELLRRLVQVNESRVPGPEWTFKEASPKYIEMLSMGLIGFSMEMDSFIGKAKLSQDFSVEDRQNMIKGLDSIGNKLLSSEMDQTLQADLKREKKSKL